jgi:two-component system, NarL family, nitrate/nitrite response regulator NarL
MMATPEPRRVGNCICRSIGYHLIVCSRPLYGDLLVDCRAVLVSERRLLRDALKDMLQKSRISVIGEARDVPDLLAAIELQADPELVICHIASDQSPEVGLELVYGLRRHFAQAKLVVLADACTRSLLSSFVGADVNAILLTSISSEMLQRSLELVLFDHRLFPAEIMSLMTENAPARPALDPAPAARLPSAGAAGIPAARALEGQVAQPGATAADPPSKVALSRREQQIIDCLVCGLPNKAIARELNITEATVKVYVKGLLRKIKVSNRTQVAIWALQQSRPAGPDRAVPLIGALDAPVELRGRPGPPGWPAG